MASYLFVYGTLLRGETNNHILDKCDLVEYTYLRGTLYDTGSGYPAAFMEEKDHKVFGELYKLPSDSNTLLLNLDELESTSEELFVRQQIRKEGRLINFYTGYRALKKQIIEHGSWLRYKSLAISDPVRFALNFEKSLKNQYRKMPPVSFPGYISIPGEIPVLITSPHGTTHRRDGKLKRYEVYTSAISAILHAKTDAHALYSNFFCNKDANYYDDSPFKNKIKEAVKKYGIGLVVDIHGTGDDKNFSLYPGMGKDREFVRGRKSLITCFYDLAAKYSLEVGEEDVFPAFRQNTVAKYCSQVIGISSIQIEINKEYRKPETKPYYFVSVINFLKEFTERTAGKL